MIEDLRRWAGALVERVHGFFRRTDRVAVAVRWALAILLFVLSLLVLVLLGWLLRGAGLWGDLAFAVLVTTAIFWIARQAAAFFLGEDAGRALPRAFATTVFVLIGIPVAYVTRPWGLVLLLAPVVLWALFQFAYWVREKRMGATPPRFPVFWQAEVVGVALLAVVLFVAPSVGSADRVPQAVPVDGVEGGEQDLAVAEAFRPLLFFDSGERRFPLDIQDAIADDRVQICRKAVGDDNCSVLESAELIDMSQDYLELEEAPGTPRGGNETSAIYYHVTRPEGGEQVYVDYWWFYSRNPSPVADKVFCGPGLRWPPFTCQEHAGDWEGLTAVLAPCTDGDDGCETVGDESLAPEEIRYGQHEHVVAYDWDETLVPFWSTLDIPPAAAVQETWQEVVLPAIADAGVHAIAFVARNSHASYPSPCFGGCKQETRDLPEAVHNGAVPWAHNAECVECVKRLPLTSEGEPALWNAFPGRWGEQHCILAGAYCDLSGAPKGPAFQTRYKEPDGEVVEICLSGTRLRPC
ncbi:MAG TPA: hypothetical protein VLA87_03975 [Gaiellaceae bacterium]|nr:hypothetical protein [Gaiellaceae bacterium]